MRKDEQSGQKGALILSEGALQKCAIVNKRTMALDDVLTCLKMLEREITPTHP